MSANENRGVLNLGGTNTMTNFVVGDRASMNVGQPEQPVFTPAGARWHLGIVTVLAKETRAVLDVLGLTDDGAGGQRFYTGAAETPSGVTRLVATQPTGQGQRPIMAALANLRDRYDPSAMALVGIAGAIHPDLAVDDVVIATRVVFYENRKLLRGRTSRRGQELAAPAPVIHAVNTFFSASGEPARLPGVRGGEPFHVHQGPIGSGEAVVADADDENRRYLRNYNDKTLAVEMEAGGLSQFCHDTTTKGGHSLGWVVVRGIADRADVGKDDRHHDSAAVNAAQVLRCLIPCLRPGL
jgi:adenosylhomocysteine nucleosidase